MNQNLSFKVYNPEGAERIVFFNPLGSSSLVWQGILKIFDERFELVTFDYPGFLNSPYFEITSIEELSSIIDKQLLTFSKKPLHVIGYSFGSWIAQQIVSKHNHDFKSIILLGASDRIYNHGKELINIWIEQFDFLGLEKISQQIALWSFYTDSFEKNPELSYNFYCSFKMAVQSDQVILAQLKQASIYSQSIDYSKINIPTLILRGEFDFFFPAFCSKKINEGILNSKLTEIPNAAHAILIENPVYVTKQIMKFIL